MESSSNQFVNRGGGLAYKVLGLIHRCQQYSEEDKVVRACRVGENQEKLELAISSHKTT